MTIWTTMTNSQSSLNSVKFGIESILSLPSVGPSSQPVMKVPAPSLSPIHPVVLDYIIQLQKENWKLKTEHAKLKTQMENFTVQDVVTAFNSLSQMSGSSLTFTQGPSSSIAPAARALSPQSDSFQFLDTTRLSFLHEPIRSDVMTHLDDPNIQKLYRFLGDKNKCLFNENKNAFPQEVLNAKCPRQFLGEKVPYLMGRKLTKDLEKVQAEQKAKGWVVIVTTQERSDRANKRKMEDRGNADGGSAKRQCGRSNEYQG